MKSKKGQMTLSDAPTVVLLVGLVFLVMATIALVADNYGTAVAGSRTATGITNETLTTVTEVGEYVANAGACGFQKFGVSEVNNATGQGVVPSTNYTVGSGGLISFTSGITSGFNNTDWNVSYTFTGGGTACNVTTDLNTEIANNTSIAGIVLTISLVGIVLTVLMGVFLTIRRRTI